MTRNLEIGFCFHTVEKLLNCHTIFYCLYIYDITYISKYTLHVYLHNIYLNKYIY